MAERTVEQDTYWLLYFEDADRVDELFTDEICARKRYIDCQQNWACTLFKQAGSIKVDDIKQAADLASIRKDAERWRKALEEIAELTSKRQLPITHQVNELATKAIKGTEHDEPNN